jgi:hypothetical protein
MKSGPPEFVVKVLEDMEIAIASGGDGRVVVVGTSRMH